MKSRIDEQTDKREWKCRVKPKGINFHSLSEKVRQNKCNLKFLNDKLAWHKPSVEKLFFIMWIKTEKGFFWGVCILPNGTFCWGFRSAKLLSIILVQEKINMSDCNIRAFSRWSSSASATLWPLPEPSSTWLAQQDPTKIHMIWTPGSDQNPK